MRIHLLYRVLNFLPILPYTSALHEKTTWKFFSIYCNTVHGTLYLGLHHNILQVEQNSYEHVSRGNPIKLYTTGRKKGKNVGRPKEEPKDNFWCRIQKRSCDLFHEDTDSDESSRSMIGWLP